MNWNCIFERVAETQSTNDDLLTRWRLGDLIDPVARIARNQTNGKGRAGRSWLASPDDSLCFSLAYPFQRKPSELSGLSLVAGLAIISGIGEGCNLTKSELYETGIRLKWPNDLLLKQKKVGGILIEGGQRKAEENTWMILGVGLNLRNATNFERKLKDQDNRKIGALNDLLPNVKELPDTDFLWLKLIESLEKYVRKFDCEGFGPFRNEWVGWDAYAGEKVCISGSGKDSIEGIARGVDINGALLIEQNDKVLNILAGDVSLRSLI